MNGKTLNQFMDELKNSGPDAKEMIEIADDVSDIVNSIVKSRIEKGMTQRDLAKMCGLKQSAIARLETLQAVPNLNTLVKIARKLDLKIGITELESPVISVVHTAAPQFILYFTKFQVKTVTGA